MIKNSSEIRLTRGEMLPLCYGILTEAINSPGSVIMKISTSHYENLDRFIMKIWTVHHENVDRST